MAELLYTVPSYSRLPDIMKSLKSRILVNLHHSASAIRFASLQILFLEIKQGLEYPIDCIEKVVLLLLDEDQEVIPAMRIQCRHRRWRCLCARTSTPTSIPFLCLASLLP